MQGNIDFGRITVFGEVLFDVFPDESRIIGGAPFNVACHLRGLGPDPLFISRVGADDPGCEVLRHMVKWSMSTKQLQVDEHRPTGMVLVRFKDGEPYYEIREDAAFDQIMMPEQEADFLEKVRLFYHGTLAARNKVSRDTLYALAGSKDQKVFCDINLRDPWWTREFIKDILSWSTYLKVNLDELEQVAMISGVQNTETVKKARAVQEKAGLECLVLTMGAEGGILFPDGKDQLFSSAPEIEDFKDTVGAGDAFSAVFLLGIVRGWSWEKILQRAVYLAAEVCAIKGAMPEDMNFYKYFSREWGM